VEKICQQNALGARNEIQELFVYDLFVSFSSAITKWDETREMLRKHKNPPLIFFSPLWMRPAIRMYMYSTKHGSQHKTNNE
jgi:hypothetical protein